MCSSVYSGKHLWSFLVIFVSPQALSASSPSVMSLFPAVENRQMHVVGHCGSVNVFPLTAPNNHNEIVLLPNVWKIPVFSSLHITDKHVEYRGGQELV